MRDWRSPQWRIQAGALELRIVVVEFKKRLVPAGGIEPTA